jgi:tetratricopeptide (TPR) repeat protein
VPAALVLLLAASLLAASASFDQAFRTGLIALQRNDLAAAESNFLAAAKLQPESGRVWIALAQTYWKLHDAVKAEEAAGKASRLGPNDPAVLQSLVIYYSESNRIPEAAEAQGRFAAAMPADRSAAERAAALYFEAAQPLLQGGNFAGAISMLQAATTKIGKDAQLQLALGVAYYGLRRFDEASDAFLNSIALAPEVEQPYLFLGRILDQIPQRLPEITKRFIAFEEANPANYEGYLLHAKALDAQTIEPETARKLLTKAIGMNASDASAYFELGALLDRMHLFSESAAEFERAAVLQPGDAATHYRLSRLYDRLNNPEAAAAERERHRQLTAAQDKVR